jgi:hypothetical protein
MKYKVQIKLHKPNGDWKWTDLMNDHVYDSYEIASKTVQRIHKMTHDIEARAKRINTNQ